MVDTLCIIYYNRHYSVCYRLTRQKPTLHEERDYVNMQTGGKLSSLFTQVKNSNVFSLL